MSNNNGDNKKSLVIPLLIISALIVWGVIVYWLISSGVLERILGV